MTQQGKALGPWLKCERKGSIQKLKLGWMIKDLYKLVDCVDIKSGKLKHGLQEKINNMKSGVC